MDMKMTTSLSGPDLSLHSGETYDLTADQAVALFKAGFAGPTKDSKADLEKAVKAHDEAVAKAEAEAAAAAKADADAAAKAEADAKAKADAETKK